MAERIELSEEQISARAYCKAHGHVREQFDGAYNSHTRCRMCGAMYGNDGQTPNGYWFYPYQPPRLKEHWHEKGASEG